jgi:hypothetical protein
MKELLTFCFFYWAVLFMYSIIGMVLFREYEEFGNFRSAAFTLIQTTIFKGNYKVMEEKYVTGNVLVYVYFMSFVVLNVVLLLNLIVAQLVHAYTKYN